MLCEVGLRRVDARRHERHRRAGLRHPFAGGALLLEEPGRSAGRRGCVGLELPDLLGERPPPRMQLDHDALGRGACEPQLAAARIEPVALSCHGDPVRDRRQLPRLDDPDALEQPRHRLAAGGRAGMAGQRLCGGRRRRRGCVLPRAARRHERDERPEPLDTRALGQLEGGARVCRHDGRRTERQRRRDGALVARLDVERCERQLGARVGQSPRGRREPLPLGEAAVERGQPLGREPGGRLERLPLLEGGARPAGSLACGGLGRGELVDRGLVARRVRQAAKPASPRP